MADPYTQEEIDTALTALIAYAGNVAGARRYLQAQGERCPAATTLAAWPRTIYWERYEELREQFAAKQENTLANNYLDAARSATEVMMKAVALADRRIEDGTDPDPGRTAANLSKVHQVAIDKRLSIQGRPTVITETRNINEILRSLAARGVVELPEGPAELDEATPA